MPRLSVHAAFILLSTCLILASTACGGGSDASTPPAGWRTFSASGIELSLPSSYDGGAPNSPAFDALIERLRNFGGPVTAQQMETQRDLAARLKSTGNALSLVMSMVNVEGPYAGVTASFSKGTSASLTDFAAAFERDRSSRPEAPPAAVRIAGQSGLKSQTQVDSSSSQTASVTSYYFEGEGGVWVITYSCLEESCAALTPDFERSARSIRLLD